MLHQSAQFLRDYGKFYGWQTYALLVFSEYYTTFLPQYSSGKTCIIQRKTENPYIIQRSVVIYSEVCTIYDIL